MKHCITRFVHYRDDQNEKLKVTDKYDSLEQAGSVLSDILKSKLSKNWDINAFSNEYIAELGGNIITMVQGENSSKILSTIWVIHPDPEPVTKDGIMFPEYAEISEEPDNDIPEKLTDVEFAEQFLDHMIAKDSQTLRLNKMRSMSMAGGFIYALVETIKMYPVASAGVGFFLFWLFFL